MDIMSMKMGTDDNVVVAFDENLFRLYKQTQKKNEDENEQNFCISFIMTMLNVSFYKKRREILGYECFLC